MIRRLDTGQPSAMHFIRAKKSGEAPGQDRSASTPLTGFTVSAEGTNHRAGAGRSTT